MTDIHPLDALDEAIEKARGMIPGGSRAGIRRLGAAHGKRRGGVYKSIDDLDVEIEKALRINGGVKVSPAQRRKIAMDRGHARNNRAGFSIHRGPHLGSGRKGKPSGYTDMGNRAGAHRGAVSRNPKNDKYRQSARRLIDAYDAAKGQPSKFKRRVFGGLKRVKKADDITKAKAKTLYVYRPVENHADIIAWAESQGFTSTQPGEKLHVTLAYSKTPLNWAHLHDDYHLEPSEYARSCGCEMVSRSDDNSKRRKISGGVREVKALGAEGAVVLAFESDSLTQRWMDFKRAGAVWSFPSFTPHITITYSGKGVDLTKVLPYVGDIILGEECWEEVDENGQASAIAAEKVTKAGLDALNARLTALETKPAAEAA
jgi:hypothetical protein